MLLTQAEGTTPKFQRLLYKKYVSSEIFGNLYAKNWLNINTSADEVLSQLPFHDLVSMLSSRDHYSSAFTADGYVKVSKQ